MKFLKRKSEVEKLQEIFDRRQEVFKELQKLPPLPENDYMTMAAKRAVESFKLEVEQTIQLAAVRTSESSRYAAWAIAFIALVQVGVTIWSIFSR